MTQPDWREEVSEGRRFQFGRNWQRYSRGIRPEQVASAKKALEELLGTDVRGRSFLDAGCGSGIHSLAAVELGARVLSFDYDPDAVATAQRLRDGRGISPGLWVIQQGSVLDRDYLAGLGSYDIVYSWGVLHHTGAMWQAIGNVLSLVAPGGLFALAIYNDQGEASRRALAMKQRYNRSGPIVRAAMLAIFTARQTLIGLAADVFRRRNPLERYRGVGRGMRVWYDIVDWVGGYPFEVATRNQVVAAVEKDGFTLVSVVDVGGGSGNNQFVFRRTEDASDTSDPSGSPASAE